MLIKHKFAALVLLLPLTVASAWVLPAALERPCSSIENGSMLTCKPVGDAPASVETQAVTSVSVHATREK